MITTKQQQDEINNLAEPLIKWLNENCIPHVKIIITPTSVELLEVSYFYPTFEFVKD